MTIPFSLIPSNVRVPLFYAEIDNSKANTAPRPQRTLLIGQKLAAGDAVPNTPILCQGLADAKARCGAGSILAAMADAYLQNDPLGELWLLPLADDGSAVAATGSIPFGGVLFRDGVLSLYLGGTLLAVPLTAGMTLAQIATAVAAAVNADADLLVTAAVDGTLVSKVNFTAKNKGLAGNDIDIRVNYLGARAGEVWPNAISAGTIVPMSGGMVNPSLTTALANLAELGFDFIVSPYTDTTSTSAISAFLSDASGRWNPLQKLYGHCFIAYRGTQGQAATFLATLNDQHLTCIPFYDSPTTKFAIAAAFAGAAAVSLRNDPGQPLQTLAVAGVLPPPVASRYTLTQRNSLLYEGGSTFTVTGGAVAIENLITTYQTNTLGQPDDSYLEIETLFLLMYVLRQLQAVVTTKYARRKLAADGTRLLPGSNVVTPTIIKADLIAQYRELEAAGYVQKSDVFAQGITVEKDASNPNRVNVLYPATLVDQLRIFATLVQFRLQ